MIKGSWEVETSVLRMTFSEGWCESLHRITLQQTAMKDGVKDFTSDDNRLQ